MSLNLYPFDETLACLDEINEWLCSQGYRAHDRIRKYQKNIRDMIALQSSDEGLSSLQDISDEKRREIVWSYFESEEFVHAVSPLRRALGDKVAVVPVGRVLDGPADLSLETQRNSHGRNFMFEVVIGGRLARAGFTPEYDRGPDVQFNFDRYRIGIQCKRPFSHSGIEETIKKAISQLQGDNPDVGIIAMSISRLWNKGNPDEILLVQDSQKAQAYFDQKAREVAYESRRFWHGKLKRAGILFYSYTPVSFRIENGRYGYTAVRTETICPISDCIATNELLMSLGIKLGA